MAMDDNKGLLHSVISMHAWYFQMWSLNDEQCVGLQVTIETQGRIQEGGLNHPQKKKIIQGFPYELVTHWGQTVPNMP